MSKLLLTVSLFMVALVVQAQCLECAPDSFPSEQEMVKWQKKCAKKVFAPLSKSAARNPNGSLEYQEYTFSERGMKMRTVELDYVSKMQSVPGLVYASMRVDGDTTYYFTLDSMYVFDRGSRLLSAQSFLDLQWDYFVENTFLSFYVYSRFVPSGSAGHKLRCYANNSSAMLVDFTAPVLSGRSDGLRDPYHPGRHNYVLDKNENSLIQYTYEPVPEEAARLGYTKKSYQLLRKTPVYELAVPDIIKQRNKKSINQ